jgi:hypothetical protein
MLLHITSKIPASRKFSVVLIFVHYYPSQNENLTPMVSPHLSITIYTFGFY